MKKKAHYTLTGIIELKTGTRIGGSDELLQIGATDLTVIKNPTTLKPYLPGSSIKGKMRAELEKVLEKFSGNEPCGCAESNCPVCRIFGPHKKTDHRLGPTRILVRDAECVTDGTLEIKTESTNQRQTGVAAHPRKVERVVPGNQFKLEIAIQVFDIDKDFIFSEGEGDDKQESKGENAVVHIVDYALRLMESTGLGGSISRGYGAIKIDNLKIVPSQSKRRLILPK